MALRLGGNRDQGNRKLNEDDIPRGLDLRPDDFAWMTEQIMGVRLRPAKFCFLYHDLTADSRLR
jgi:hypothetical protein|eukprot:COSAG02_NODE_510_length_20863_cov_139.455233_11_plen_64_part_00